MELLKNISKFFAYAIGNTSPPEKLYRDVKGTRNSSGRISNNTVRVR
uniref:Uncharacterized protein n=1 Tax=Anguilla anguilla TaxID=7936 RepID=A0A0E9T4A2_ANGAN